jgi:methyl-accepting chemotaxis protein
MASTSIKSKIAAVAGLCLLATAAVLVVYSILSSRSSQSYVMRSVTELVNTSTEEGLLTLATSQADYVASKIQVNLDAARTLAQTFAVLKTQYDKDPAALANVAEVMSEILRHVLEGNPEFLGTYTAWEPYALDERDAEFAGDEAAGRAAAGRFVPYWNRDENGNIARQMLVEFENRETHANGVLKGGWYLGPRETGREIVLDPFPYVVQGKQEWLTSISVPIVVKDHFLGVAGTDLRLSFLQDLSRKARHGRKGTLRIVTHDGLLS